MNIGMFTDTYYPQINGLVTSLKMLEKEMAKRGHRLFIFTTSYPTAEKNTENVYRLPSISLKFSPSHRVAIIYPPRLLVGMKKFKLDIVHTHSEFPLGIFGKLVSEVYGKPIIHTYHTLWEEYVHYFGRSRIVTKNNARRYSRLFCNGVDAVIAPTEKTRRILESYGIKKEMAVIPTGIDFEPFKPSNYTKQETDDLKNELGIPLDAPIIMNIGRIGKEKSIDKILSGMPELLKTVPKLRFVIVGDGPALAGLKELSAELGIEGSVDFLGSRPWTEIGKYYRLGDVFVSASCSETQGLTYVEAIASGLTVVVREDDCSKEIITDGETGFCFSDNEGMIKAIIDALNMTESDREAMRVKGYERIQGLSAERFAENIENFYMKVIDRYNEKRKSKGIIPPLRLRLIKALKRDYNKGKETKDNSGELAEDTRSDDII